MSASLSSSASEPSERTKRAACDYCREQKLKCARVPGGANSEQPCVRCARSGRQCINSSSKRPGRPRNSDKQQEPEAERQQERKSSEAGTTLSSSDRGYSSSSLSSALNTASTIATTASLNSPLEDPTAVMDNPSLLHVDSWFTKTILDNAVDPTFRMWDLVDADPSADENHVLSSSRNNSVLDHAYVDPGANEPYLDIQSSQHQHHQHQHPNTDMGFDTDDPSSHVHHMAVDEIENINSFNSLQQDLSKQFFVLQSMSIDIAQVTRLTCCNHDLMDTDSPKAQVLKHNPLAQVIESVKQFSRLLQAAYQCSGSPIPSVDSNTSPLSSVDLLSILSCHMIIITIFDAILGHFDQQVGSGSSLWDTAVRSTPQLKLGGIVVPSQLEILRHILCSLMTNYLWPVEGLLGLSDEFCVSMAGEQDKENNQHQRHERFFGGASGRTLFEALMKVDTERSDYKGELSVIDRLKSRLARTEDRQRRPRTAFDGHLQ